MGDLFFILFQTAILGGHESIIVVAQRVNSNAMNTAHFRERTKEMGSA